MPVLDPKLEDDSLLGIPFASDVLIRRDILGSLRRSDGQHAKKSNILLAISSLHRADHSHKFLFIFKNCSLLIVKLSLAPSIIPILDTCFKIHFKIIQFKRFSYN